MFYCAICGELQGPKVPQYKVVVETMAVVHKDEVKVDNRKYTKETPGKQIVREVNSCKACYEAVGNKGK